MFRPLTAEEAVALLVQMRRRGQRRAVPEAERWSAPGPARRREGATAPRNFVNGQVKRHKYAMTVGYRYNEDFIRRAHLERAAAKWEELYGDIGPDAPDTDGGE